MAACTTCGKKLGIFSASMAGMCEECGLRLSNSQSGTSFETRNSDAKNRKAVDAIVLTTETAPNLNITKRIEIVTAECAFGMNIFKDLFAGIRNVVGGRSEAIQSAMRDARETVLYELKREAHRIGANAVVGIDLDYVELAGAGSSMLMLVASGTAVVIEEEKG